MRRFLIAGCQRSGTTLMRLVLETHTEIQCFDEARAYNILTGHADLPVSEATLVGFKIPAWSEQLLDNQLEWNGGSLVAEYSSVANFYRGEPIIFLIRRAVDTVSSMRQLKTDGGSWLEKFGVPIVHNHCKSLYFREIFRSDLDIAFAAQDKGIAFGAIYWKVKSIAALRYLDAGLPIHLVFYEQLVMDPATVLSGVLEHLGMEWDERLLSHHLGNHSELFSGRTIGNTDPSRPIDSLSIGLGEQRIAKSGVDAIQRIAGPLESTLGSLDVSRGHCHT